MAPSNRWYLSLFVILMSLLFYLIFIYTMALESGWKNLEISDFVGLIIFVPFTIGMFLCMCFVNETQDQRQTKKHDSGKGEEGGL